MNTAKTIVFSIKPINILLKTDKNIEQISNIKYFGTILNEKCNNIHWEQLQFTRQNNSVLHIFSILLYACESPEMESRITSIEEVEDLMDSKSHKRESFT